MVKDVASPEQDPGIRTLTGEITEIKGDQSADSMTYMACSLCYAKIMNTTWSITGGYRCTKCQKTV